LSQYTRLFLTGRNCTPFNQDFLLLLAGQTVFRYNVASQTTKEKFVSQQQHPARRTSPWAIFTLIVVLLVVLWIVITRLSNPEAGAEPPPFTAEVLSPAPPITSIESNIVFQDNFDHTVGAWELSPIGQADYVNGVMFLEDSDINGEAWSRPHLRFQDFLLDIDSRWLGGSVGGSYGVRFRLQDTGEFLGLYVHNDGWFTVVQNGAESPVTLYEAFSPSISRAGEANRIHIEAKGNSFRFYVNGAYLVDVQIEAPVNGDIMLVAQKVEGTESFRVGFDNLVIALHPESELLR